MLSVGLLIASVPSRYERQGSPCTGGGECAVGQLAPQELSTLADLRLSLGAYAAYQVALQVVFSAVFLAVAALIFWRRSDDRMALFASLVLLVATPAISMHGLEDRHPVWEAAVRSFTFLFWSSFLPFLFLFPDGRFVPRWTRRVAVFVIALQVPQSFFPGSLLSTENWPAPLHGMLALGLWGTALFAQVYRYHRVSGSVARQQTKWLVFGFVAAFLLSVGFLLVEAAFPPFARSGAPYEIVSATASVFVWSILPLAIGVAILRYRLWDIDPIINRTLVYGALTACVVGLYVLVVGYLGAVFRVDNNLAISLVATGVVAVLFQPLRERLQRSVDRLMYGERNDPYGALSRLGEQLEATLEPEAVLPTVVRTVREALRLPYAAMALREGKERVVAAESGSPPGDPLRLPLAYQGEEIGELILAPRAPGEGFSSADRRLLDDLARQAGIAAHAVRLTADLQRSRERLVATREEERRRIRRDLHDGLGPMLGSLTLKLGVADDLVEENPAAAHALLRGLKEQSQRAVADIRRLVYALRPPALDDPGLIGAIRETAAQLGADGLNVSVDAPCSLPDLPAAAEVAAYRIAQEALTNVARHAAARECVVRLVLEGAGEVLRLEIRDDGLGLPPGRGRGVGLTSMVERAAELGGRCVVESAPEGGTRVRAALPCPRPKASPEPEARE